jgi:hypothetical protein
MAGDVRRFGGVGDACDEVLCCRQLDVRRCGRVQRSATRLWETRMTRAPLRELLPLGNEALASACSALGH